MASVHSSEHTHHHQTHLRGHEQNEGAGKDGEMATNKEQVSISLSNQDSTRHICPVHIMSKYVKLSSNGQVFVVPLKFTRFSPPLSAMLTSSRESK